MNIRSRTVNVERQALLKALKENLAIHKVEYAQALLDFKARLEEDLRAGVALVEQSEPLALKDFRLNVIFPQNHEADYQQVIDMLEFSVDDNIQIDSESFNAYFKNQWSWTGHFLESNTMYKTAGAFLKA